MGGRDFWTKIKEHEALNWLGCREGENPEDDVVLVTNSLTGARFAVSVSAILEREWVELEGVFLGTRQPRILTHVTRIVGYFSQLQNWNRSKIAELRDRQKGNYSLEPSPAKIAPAVPSIPRARVAVPA